MLIGGGGGVEVVDDGAFMLLSFRFGSLLSFELFGELACCCCRCGDALLSFRFIAGYRYYYHHHHHDDDDDDDDDDC